MVGWQDAGAGARRVRLVCAFLGALLRNRLPEMAPLLPELQTFCIQHSRNRCVSQCTPWRLAATIRSNQSLEAQAPSACPPSTWLQRLQCRSRRNWLQEVEVSQGALLELGLDLISWPLRKVAAALVNFPDTDQLAQ